MKMRATIKSCAGTENLLYYNEKKTRNKAAQCIYAGNFIKEAADLSAKEKRRSFAGRRELNQRFDGYGVSLVLEFTPGKHLDNDSLIDIAWDFMKEIGFGHQPYLVYRHDDTLCQHLHIVTTNITAQGKKISDKKIAIRVIQPARKAIINKYGLDVRPSLSPDSHDPRQKVQYGKHFTRQMMLGTLQYVLDNYRYRSIEELNAALRLYNLKAINGSPDSWLRQHRGLLYQVLDDNGKAMNAPIKASDIGSKPTLNKLEQTFEKNRAIAMDTRRTRQSLDAAIENSPTTPGEFAASLRRSRVEAVPFFHRGGQLKDLFFVDLVSRSVSSPADLGKNYEPAAIRESLGFDPFVKQIQSRQQQHGKQRTAGHDRSPREQQSDSGIEL